MRYLKRDAYIIINKLENSVIKFERKKTIKSKPAGV